MIVKAQNELEIRRKNKNWNLITQKHVKNFTDQKTWKFTDQRSKNVLKTVDAFFA